MVHKILRNFDNLFHCKHSQFKKTNSYYSAYSLTKSKSFFSWLGIRPINSLFVSEISQPNETVLAAKQDRFIALAKIQVTQH